MEAWKLESGCFNMAFPRKKIDQERKKTFFLSPILNDTIPLNQ
jgi:hypothetical protein